VDPIYLKTIKFHTWWATWVCVRVIVVRLLHTCCAFYYSVLLSISPHSRVGPLYENLHEFPIERDRKIGE
jgi:hypothetical protein